MNIKYKNLVEAFLRTTDKNQKCTFILSEEEELIVDFRTMKSNSKRILSYLNSIGAQAGDEVFLQIKDNIDLIGVFWACILGGMIPIPYNYIESSKELSVVEKILKKLSNPFILCDVDSYEKLFSHETDFDLSALKHKEKSIVTTEKIYSVEGMEKIVESNPKDIAFIQYSSGSTSEPKGAIITHENIIENAKAKIKSMQIKQDDSYLSWLPLTHSFGMIGMHITPLLAGLSFYVMPTNIFVLKPLLWLKKISEHRVTITASPNFGLKYVANYLAKTKNIDIDLSHLKIIINGAEPVSAEVCKRFISETRRMGLKESVIRPSYGLSEATLVVSTPRYPRKFKEIIISRKNLGIGDNIVELDSNDNNSVGFVEVGEVVQGCEIDIVDDSNFSLGQKKIGRVLIKSNMVFKGYYKDIENTEIALKDGWLVTGDLGFMFEDKLVITGREKDVIFIKGENYYSYDIERTCQELDDIKPYKIAVCAVFNYNSQKDEIACFIEYNDDLRQFNNLSKRLKSYIISKMGLGISWCIPINTIPVTVSGKVKRYLLSKQIQEGEISEKLYF